MENLKTRIACGKNKVFGVTEEGKILVTGVEDPGTQAHSVNESLHLGVFERAAVTEALLLAKLGEPE